MYFLQNFSEIYWETLHKIRRQVKEEDEWSRLKVPHLGGPDPREEVAPHTAAGPSTRLGAFVEMGHSTRRPQKRVRFAHQECAVGPGHPMRGWGTPLWVQGYP